MPRSSDHTFHGAHDPDEANAITESLQRLEGVRHARLDPPGASVPDRIHVVMADGWRPETVRRDVQALLLQRHGLNLDAGAIHAAGDTVDEPPPPPEPEPEAGARPVLDAVHLALRSRGTSVGIELVADERRLRGSAGPVGPTGVWQAVAQATLRALEEGLPHELEAAVTDVVTIGGDRIAMATVVASDDRSRQRLTGSSIVRGNTEDAMARAVLDATNRLWRSPAPSGANGHRDGSTRHR